MVHGIKWSFQTVNFQISETTFCCLTLFHLSCWWWSIPYLTQPWWQKQTFAVAEVRLKWCFLIVVAAPKDGQGYIEVVIGGLTAIMLLLLVVFVVILVLSRRQKLQGSPTILRNPFGVTINMKVPVALYCSIKTMAFIFNHSFKRTKTLWTGKLLFDLQHTTSACICSMYLSLKEHEDNSIKLPSVRNLTIYLIHSCENSTRNFFLLIWSWFLQSIYQPTMHLKTTIQDKYHTPTCFSTEVPSSETLLEKRNTYPTC